MRPLKQILILVLALLAHTQVADARPRAPGKYADVNGLKLYYEVHGKGDPIVVIHGAFCTIDVCMRPLVKLLAKDRKVIAVELQGHGRTADIDRPLSTVHMAGDIAALLDKLGIARADIYGYSMGGGVAAQLAMRHPDRVRKVIIAGASLTKEGSQPGALDAVRTMKPEMLEASPFFAAYKKTSPHPDRFRTLVRKVQHLDTLDGFARADIKKITAPVLVLMGDADLPTVEHGAELLRLFGGGAFGDTGAPRAKSQLAILPGTSHLGLMEHPDWIAALVRPFLAAD